MVQEFGHFITRNLCGVPKHVFVLVSKQNALASKLSARGVSVTTKWRSFTLFLRNPSITVESISITVEVAATPLPHRRDSLVRHCDGSMDRGAQLSATPQLFPKIECSGTLQFDLWWGLNTICFDN